VWQSITYDLISRKVVYNILEFCNLMKLVRLIKMCSISSVEKSTLDKIE